MIDGYARVSKAGDEATVVVCSLGFRSLGDAWGDTTTAHGRLMPFVLGGLAEFERELVREIARSYNVSHSTISGLAA